MCKMRTPIGLPKRTKRGPPSERYEGRAGDALVRIHGALHDCKKGEGEREREWTWEPRHAVTGKSQPRRRKKSWAHVRVRASPLSTSFLLPDEMTVPGREMDRIMG